MKLNKIREVNVLSILLLALVLFGTYIPKDVFAQDIKLYLDQHSPGMIPEIFAPGIVSTEKGELNCAISPDGNEIYFSRWSQSQPTVIMVIEKDLDGWGSPQIASFSGTYSDVDPSLSVDGKKLFFGSIRPSGKLNARGSDIWMAERMNLKSDWSNPFRIGDSINTLENENYPTVTKEGSLYFHSRGYGGYGGLDIFKSAYQNGEYLAPSNLGTAINSANNEFDAFIARDESYLIFSSKDRPDGYGSGDLYISFKNKNGSWTPALNMGDKINSSSMDLCPSVSPENKYFFFTSERSGNGDIYWVDAGIIEKLKPGEIR